MIAVQRLEKHFKYGICCFRSDKATIFDAMKISLIVSFSTSESGWEKVGNGELIEKAEGSKDGSHAAVVEGYDFEKRCLICKNSWGGNTAEPRFNLKTSATHGFHFTHVYFTLDSIKGKTTKSFTPRIDKFMGDLNGYRIHCCWMDEITAIYSSDYICELHEEKNDQCNYHGYDINEYITCKLIPYIPSIASGLLTTIFPDFSRSATVNELVGSLISELIKDSKIYNLTN